MNRRNRCAIYTRKSTEEGLDQDYNSLEAQRDACLAYIKSQASQGWAAIKTKYDDGGVSGATMERPALQRLLDDIDAGKVDVVVVYKVDRLTRSLSDFAKMVERFDKRAVSFVSVTQQFNTTSSMGRLTLNVLLSFAQFEREVTAERIRDKIAASKKKGKWMGGVVPLGYDVVDRKLVVNEAEAKTVRALFDLYRRIGTVNAVKDESDRLGLRTKVRKPNNGKRGGCQPFQPGHLYKLLSNRTYIGEIVHKGIGYPGEHESIINRETWDNVQAQLMANARTRHHRTNTKSPCLLIGLLYDEDGDRLSPRYCIKKGCRYWYYVSRNRDSRPRWHLPANALDATVADRITGLLADENRLLTDIIPPATPAHEIKGILTRSAKLGNTLRNNLTEQRPFLQEMIDRIVLTQNQIRVQLRTAALQCRLDVVGSFYDESASTQDTLFIDMPMTLKRRGRQTKLIIADGIDTAPSPDAALIKTIHAAHQWFAALKTGDVETIRDLATRHGVDKGDVSRILPLAFLAPEIVEAILNGRQPVELTAHRLKRLRYLPMLWNEQRRILGFEAVN